MRMIIAIAAILSACGRSECQDYSTVICHKSIGCDAPRGANTQTQETCERGATSGIEAGRMTEAACKQAREYIVGMTCAEYRVLIDTILKR